MDYQTLRHNCPTWDDYIQHDFVKQLTAGTLAPDSFRHYLVQDYLYLIHYTRVMALSVYKSDTLAQMRVGQAGINAMLDMEIAMYLDFCRQWNIPLEQVENAPESAVTIAYSRYILDAAMSGSLAELYAAIAPCLMGYGEIGRCIKDEGFIDNNPYQPWIDVFSSDEFQVITAQNEAQINTLLADASPAQADKFQRLFNTAARMEVNFWQQALDLS
ncbi:thiaminase II [Psychrobacter sp. AOP22-C1-22]|jgi:thiaminase/transcriptional activator TenA|uniref:thiaminase II n=1 Tax=unclassified Psychrobacter TaxID=196806 RepID=UPI0017888F1D|nr:MULTISPECIES: thiaminase II [unclassified Psychrobacter]MBE0407633.1 thiaminase II [Psychrobacter sp. FME6]MBE0444846.1 thiaminase II [Psychrobacter sp. FME5]MDN5802955.1 thiaminase II [Psychrobacter sp.]